MAEIHRIDVPMEMDDDDTLPYDNHDFDNIGESDEDSVDENRKEIDKMSQPSKASFDKVALRDAPGRKVKMTTPIKHQKPMASKSVFIKETKQFVRDSKTPVKKTLSEISPSPMKEK